MFQCICILVLITGILASLSPIRLPVHSLEEPTNLETQINVQVSPLGGYPSSLDEWESIESGPESDLAEIANGYAVDVDYQAKMHKTFLEINKIYIVPTDSRINQEQKDFLESAKNLVKEIVHHQNTIQNNKEAVDHKGQGAYNAYSRMITRGSSHAHSSGYRSWFPLPKIGRMRWGKTGGDSNKVPDRVEHTESLQHSQSKHSLPVNKERDNLIISEYLTQLHDLEKTQEHIIFPQYSKKEVRNCIWSSLSTRALKNYLSEHDTSDFEEFFKGLKIHQKVFLKVLSDMRHIRGYVKSLTDPQRRAVEYFYKQLIENQKSSGWFSDSIKSNMYKILQTETKSMKIYPNTFVSEKSLSHGGGASLNLAARRLEFIMRIMGDKGKISFVMYWVSSIDRTIRFEKNQSKSFLENWNIINTIRYVDEEDYLLQPHNWVAFLTHLESYAEKDQGFDGARESVVRYLQGVDPTSLEDQEKLLLESLVKRDDLPFEALLKIDTYISSLFVSGLHTPLQSVPTDNLKILIEPFKNIQTVHYEIMVKRKSQLRQVASSYRFYSTRTGGLINNFFSSVTDILRPMFHTAINHQNARPRISGVDASRLLRCSLSIASRRFLRSLEDKNLIHLPDYRNESQI